MDYKITDHQSFINRVDEYFQMMNRAKDEKHRPFCEQGNFWYQYGQVKQSIKDYIKNHSTYKFEQHE